ncbi:MAG: hypothetical protein ACYC3L_01195 [Gemmatimonadaceae bacterium]
MTSDYAHGLLTGLLCLAVMRMALAAYHLARAERRVLDDPYRDLNYQVIQEETWD